VLQQVRSAGSGASPRRSRRCCLRSTWGGGSNACGGSAGAAGGEGIRPGKDSLDSGAAVCACYCDRCGARSMVSMGEAQSSTYTRCHGRRCAKQVKWRRGTPCRLLSKGRPCADCWRGGRADFEIMGGSEPAARNTSPGGVHQLSTWRSNRAGANSEAHRSSRRRPTSSRLNERREPNWRAWSKSFGLSQRTKEGRSSRSALQKILAATIGRRWHDLTIVPGI